MPRPELLADASEATGVDLVGFLTRLNERIEYMFDRDHQIGHAFFIGCRTRTDVDAVVRTKVIPLLAEYFHEDWSKMAAALGDGDATRFLQRTELRAPWGMGNDAGGETRYRWSVRADFAPDAYRDPS